MADGPGKPGVAAAAPAIELPKLRKVAVAPKEEPVKKEVKKTKVKIPKAKKYEELPEIPDYERPELEKYEASDFDPTVRQHEPLKHAVPTAAGADGQQPQQATVGQTPPEPKKNGLAQVGFPGCAHTQLLTSFNHPQTPQSHPPHCGCRTLLRTEHRTETKKRSARGGATQAGHGQGTAARADRRR